MHRQDMLTTTTREGMLAARGAANKHVLALTGAGTACVQTRPHKSKRCRHAGVPSLCSPGPAARHHSSAPAICLATRTTWHSAMVVTHGRAQQRTR
eukprot:365721-Chlamydomonas_euryale.AAC.10